MRRRGGRDLTPLQSVALTLRRFETDEVPGVVAGRRLFPLWAVIHHRGRRTGRPYAVPVAIRASPDAFTIPLPWGDRRPPAKGNHLTNR